MQKQVLRSELKGLAQLVVKETGFSVRVKMGGTIVNEYGEKVPSVFNHKEHSLTILYDTSRPSPAYSLAHEMAKFLRVANAPKGKQMVATPTKKFMRYAVRRMQNELNKVEGFVQFTEEELKPIYLSLLGLLVNTPGNWRKRAKLLVEIYFMVSLYFPDGVFSTGQ